MAVSKEAIVETSIEILNRDGIEGLSMRTIAKNLGIKAASLYWHFRGKSELYGAIAEYLCIHYDMPKPCENSKIYLMKACQSYRAMLLTVKDAVSVFIDSVPDSPKRIKIIKSITDALLAIGVSENNLFMMSNLLNNYVLSFVADEIQFKNMPSDALDSEIFSLFNKQDLASVDFDEQFLYGLQVLFAGMEAVESQTTLLFTTP